MIDIVGGKMKISRNDPCPCGSGKKYKHCHLDRDLNEGTPQEEKASRSRTIAILTLIGLGVSIAAGYSEGVVFGITVAAASFLIGAGYLIFSNPPPPKADAGNPAGLDFGRKD